MNMYGRSLQEVRRTDWFNLGQFTANTTVTPAPRFGVPPSYGQIRLLDLIVICDAVPSDPDGTMLLNALINDISEGADDSFVSSGDLETLVTAANRAFLFTKAAETQAEKQFTMEAGDTLRFTLVNNSAAITTNPFVQVGLIWMPLPEATANLGSVQHPSQYSAGNLNAW